MEVNNRISSQIARKLLDLSAIRLQPNDPFTWTSGIQSPIYCDNRLTLSNIEARNMILEGFKGKAAEFPDVDMIAGVATAGIPHAAFLAMALNLPLIYVRSKVKGHGKKNVIEGNPSDGNNVLVIEDLLSTGGSALKAVEELRAAGLAVAGVLAIFSYGFPNTVQAFKDANCAFATLTSIGEVLEQANQYGHISKEEQTTIESWLKSVQF